MTRPDEFHPADVDVTEQLAKDAGDTEAEFQHSDVSDVPEQVASDGAAFTTEHRLDTADDRTPVADVTEQLAKDAGDTATEHQQSDQVDVPEQLAKDAGDHL